MAARVVAAESMATACKGRQWQVDGLPSGAGGGWGSCAAPGKWVDGESAWQCPPRRARAEGLRVMIGGLSHRDLELWLILA